MSGLEERISAIEALLVASDEPVPAAELARVLDVEEAEVDEAAEALARACRIRGAGVEVVRVARGWQMRTHPRFADAVLALRGGKPQRLSRAALEVLAVVAYQQPTTRLDVESVRGVASGGSLKTLLERGLVRVVGRRDVPGRPLEYGTTDGFLELFGLEDLRALPTLAERAELEDDSGQV